MWPKTNVEHCRLSTSRAYPFFTMSRLTAASRAAELFALCLDVLIVVSHLRGWWSQTGSNRRPPACKAGALPTELWPHQATVAKDQRSRRPQSRQRLPATAEIPAPDLAFDF